MPDETKPESTREALDKFEATLPKEFDAILKLVDLGDASKQDRILQAASRYFRAVQEKCALDFPPHEAHNNVLEVARRKLGKAQGGLVQAVDGLREFVEVYGDAMKRYADACQRRKEAKESAQ